MRYCDERETVQLKKKQNIAQVSKGQCHWPSKAKDLQFCSSVHFKIRQRTNSKTILVDFQMLQEVLAGDRCKIFNFGKKMVPGVMIDHIICVQLIQCRLWNDRCVLRQDKAAITISNPTKPDLSKAHCRSLRSTLLYSSVFCSWEAIK